MKIDLVPIRFRQLHDFRSGVAQSRNLRGVLGDRGDEGSATLQYASRRWRLQPAIDDNSCGLARGLHQAHAELRIVFGDRAAASEHGTGTSTQPVATAPRILAGDPLAGPVLQRRLAVQAGGDLRANPRPAALHARDEANIQFAGIVGQQSHVDLDAGGAQLLGAASGHQRIGILHRRHDALYAGGDQGVGAGRRAAHMAARLQRDVNRGIAGGGIPGGAQGQHLRVGLASTHMPAFACHAAILDDDRANARVGRCREEPMFGKPKGLRHEGMIGGAESHGRSPVI